jgi:hypothetical protein
MVEASAERAQNVATIKLRDGQEVERSSEKSNPGGAANGIEQERARMNTRMQDGSEKSQQERSAEGQIDVTSVVESRNNFGVEHAVGQRGNRENKADKRTRSSDVKERTSGANRGTNQNEGAKGAHERGKGHKKRIAGADVMMTAGKEMAELMGEQNREQSEGEGQTGGESRGVFVKESEGVEKLVERNSLILSVGDGELSSGN